MITVEDLYEECQACKHVLSIKADLVNRLACASNTLFLTAKKVNNNNEEEGEELRIGRMIEVNCRKCMNKRRLLTETGQRLLDLFRDEIMVQD